jgi:hypothetical protein
VAACEDALTMLHHARVAAAGEASTKAKAVDADQDGKSGRSLTASRVVLGASVASPSPPLREWAAVSADSSEDKNDVARRWNAMASSWQSTAKPSVRFAYIPPIEEVQLLRDVLAMGTGSTTLMKDVHDARALLVAEQATVRALCAKNLVILQSLRVELAGLKQHLMDLVGSHGPFMLMSTDLLRCLQACIGAEVAKRLAAAPKSLYHTARTNADDSCTADEKMGTSLPTYDGCYRCV